MEDLFGNILEVGDYVIKEMRPYKVTGFTNKMVKLIMFKSDYSLELKKAVYTEIFTEDYTSCKAYPYKLIKCLSIEGKLQMMGF